jgi:hypothetical protein
MSLSIKDIKRLSQEEVLKLVEAGDIAEPVILSIPLDNALTEKLYEITGNFIGIVEATDVNTNVKIRFNRVNTEQVTFTKGLSFIRPFKRIFLTCDAQAGKSINILISSFAPEIFQIIDNRSESQQASYLQEIRDELQGSTSGTYGQDTIGTSQAQVFASNSNRKAFLVQADPANSGKIYIGFDNTVATNKAIACLEAGQSLILDDYRGAIHAISDAAGQLLNKGEW